MPVLSEQITVVQPSVSTAASLRTMAWRLAMRCMPSARVTVTTAGSPSGMAATARAMAVMAVSTRSSPRARPSANISATTTPAMTASRARQRVELDLQRRGGFGGFRQQPGQLAHLRLHAGGADDGLDATARHHGVHVDHRAPLRQRRLHGDGRRRLADRMRFAGEGGFRHLGGMGGQHARIGRNAVAGLEQQEVAGHEMLRGHERRPGAATHACDGRQHVLQRRQRRLGAMLLEEAECGVEQHHDGDDDRVLEVADRAGQHGCADQHDDEKVPELVEELAPRWARRLFGEAVGAALGQPHGGLRIGEALRGITAKLAGNLLGGQRVPGWGCRGLGVGAFMEQAGGGRSPDIMPN